MNAPQTSPARAIVLAFVEMRESCQHYNGFKERHEESQCTNPEHRTRGCDNWCALRDCPLLREEARQQGVD